MPTGQRTTYSNTTTQKRVISQNIDIIDPKEVPLLKALGYSAANIKKFRLLNAPGTTVEWLEDGYESLSATAAATNITNSTTTTTLAVSSGHGARFQVGDVIQLDSDDELIYVASISSDTLTIVRGHGGTTQVTHASNGTIYRRTRSRIEGATATDSPSTSPTTQYNVSQILQKKIEVSGTRQVVTQYGVTDEFERESEKAYIELMRDCERIAFYGQRAAGSASAARLAGGLDYFITTNVTSLTGSPALTQKHIEDKAQACWEAGGAPDLLVCNAWAQRKIRDMYVGHYRTEKDDARGGIMVDKLLVPPVGEIDVLVDRWCPPGKLYLIDTRRAGWVPIREFFDEQLAKVGDAEIGQVVGEYSFVLKSQTAHAIVKGFSTSA